MHGGLLWDPREHADSREKAQILDFTQLMSKWQIEKEASLII